MHKELQCREITARMGVCRLAVQAQGGKDTHARELGMGAGQLICLT